MYTFGSNSYGQLGVGDLSSRGSPTLVKIPSGINISMIAAGSYHTAVLTSDGDVLTWGAHLVNYWKIRSVLRSPILLYLIVC